MTTKSNKPSDIGEYIGESIKFCLVSPNECDSNWENANVVDGLFAIARAIRSLADAIRESAPVVHEDLE
jgi:hypothetical protein